LRIIFVSVIIVIIDQVSKFLVKGFSIPFLKINYEGMYHGQRIPIIGDFFRLTFIENPGMAFGFDPGINLKLWISLFSLFASIGLLIYLYFIKDHNFTLRLAIAFILGGAVGNLIDRMFYGILYGYAPLFYGKVVDFFDFDFFNVSVLGRYYDRWPIFNFADAAVSMGVIILIFFYKKHQKGTEETPVTEPGMEVQNSSEEAVSNNISENIESNIPENPVKENFNGKTDKGKELPD